MKLKTVDRLLGVAQIALGVYSIHRRGMNFADVLFIINGVGFIILSFRNPPCAIVGPEKVSRSDAENTKSKT